VSHAHPGEGPHPAERGERTRLGLALGLALSVIGIEVAGGIATGSLALFADGLHVAGDASALGLALVASVLAGRSHSTEWTFGLHRAEVLAAAVNGFVLVTLAVLLGWNAVQRLQTPAAVAGAGLLGVAAVGLVANGAQLVVLGEARSLNMRAARLHVLSDLGGSLAAIVAGAFVLATGESRADSLATLVIVGLVALAAGRLLLEAGGVLMERTPAGLDLEAVRGALLDLEGVRGVHDLHARTVSGDFITFEGHLDVAPGYEATEITSKASDLLHRRFGLHHVTLQAERPRILELE
jgi:cobalt-zinc-cadmium efflux system protein